MPTACGVGLLYASLAAAHWRLPDATRTFRVRIRSGRRVRLAFVAASFGSGSRSAHAPRCWIVGSNCRHADWPRRGRLADCFGFSQRSRECEKECGRGAGERREAGCARPSTLLAWQQADAYLFIYFCYYLSLFRFFLFSSCFIFLIGAHSL